MPLGSLHISIPETLVLWEAGGNPKIWLVISQIFNGLVVKLMSRSARTNKLLYIIWLFSSLIVGLNSSLHQKTYIPRVSTWTDRS